VVSVRGVFHRAWLVVLLGVGAPDIARTQAAAYVPLDDIAYNYIDALLARGRLRALPLMERPYTTTAIRRALAADSAGSAGARHLAPSAFYDALSRAVAAYEPAAERASPGSPAGAFEVGASIAAMATAQTSSRRELMLADSRTGVYPGAIAMVQGRSGHVVAATRIIADIRLKYDPEFTGKKERSIAGRTEDAYVSAQWKYGELFFGRQLRNWGPPALDGLLLGSYAYSYDHLYGRLGSDRIALTALVSRLDDLFDDQGESLRRFFVIHRLVFRVGGFEGALTESMVYGGIGESFRLNYLNPLNELQLSQYNERTAGNLALGIDVSSRSRFGVFSAQGLLDDAQVDKCTPRCKEPPSYGFTVEADGVPLAGSAIWFASYTRVTNLAYRTPERLERYSIFDVGLGRGFSDYDETRVGAELLALPRLPLRAYAALRRQGEGDYRLPFPDSLSYAMTPTFLSGVVMHVLRLGVSGGGKIGRAVSASGDVGVNRITNAEHVRGRSSTNFEGRVRVVIEGWRKVSRQ
jgi:hypothetical protein